MDNLKIKKVHVVHLTHDQLGFTNSINLVVVEKLAVLLLVVAMMMLMMWMAMVTAMAVETLMI